jgi:hypothetical protein
VDRQVQAAEKPNRSSDFTSRYEPYGPEEKASTRAGGELPNVRSRAGTRRYGRRWIPTWDGCGFLYRPDLRGARPSSARGPKGAGATHGQWEGAARTSTLAFQRPSPRVRNPHACNIDLPLARIRGLAIGGHKPGANQIGQHINADPMREQRCPAAVLQTCDGKQFECAALVRVDFRSVQHLLEL